MKRFHVHVSVDNIDASIRFYFPRYHSRLRRQVARADGRLLRNRADR